MKARSPARRLLKMISPRKFIVRRALIAGIAFSFIPALFATDLTWTGAVDSYWTNAANWNPPQVPSAIDHVAVNSGNVTVPASATFAILDWTGGNIYGALTIASNGVVNISGSSGKELFAAVTNANGGTINWSDTGYLELWNNNGGAPYNGSINNLAGGLFNVQSDQILYNPYGYGFFNNAGTLRKSASTGTTAVRVLFTNAGTVDARAGR